MSVEKVHIRHCMLYEFKLGRKATEATRNICSAYGKDVLDVRKCQRWFAKFRSGDMSLENKPGQGRISDFDQDALRVLVEANPCVSQQELAESFNSSQPTISRQLQSIGKVQKLGKWIPHDLSEDNLAQRFSICTSLSSRQSCEPFLERIVTGDEKWVLYVNIKRRKQWVDKDQSAEPAAKAGLHPKKVMLCVWWNMKGIIHWELLPANETITGDLYAKQLDRLQQALLLKQPALVNRKGVILLHDNARPHTSKVVKEKLKELHWEILPHPPYSPDLAPSDYHLFRSLQNHLMGRNFEDEEDLKNDIVDFFASKSVDFYSRGIQKLPERWAEVIELNGKYIID